MFRVWWILNPLRDIKQLEATFTTEAEAFEYLREMDAVPAATTWEAWRRVTHIGGMEIGEELRRIFLTVEEVHL